MYAFISVIFFLPFVNFLVSFGTNDDTLINDRQAHLTLSVGGGSAPYRNWVDPCSRSLYVISDFLKKIFLFFSKWKYIFYVKIIKRLSIPIWTILIRQIRKTCTTT